MALDYHTRMFELKAAVASGAFGNVEIAAIFTGKIDKPWYLALRDNETSEIQLVALESDSKLGS